MSVPFSQLQAIRATVEAVLAQLDAVMEQLAGEGRCPRCGAPEEDLAQAGDVKVCAGCGANVRDGAVIDG